MGTGPGNALLDLLKHGVGERPQILVKEADGVSPEHSAGFWDKGWAPLAHMYMEP